MHPQFGLHLDISLVALTGRSFGLFIAAGHTRQNDSGQQAELDECLSGALAEQVILRFFDEMEEENDAKDGNQQEEDLKRPGEEHPAPVAVNPLEVGLQSFDAPFLGEDEARQPGEFVREGLFAQGARHIDVEVTRRLGEHVTIAQSFEQTDNGREGEGLVFH